MSDKEIIKNLRRSLYYEHEENKWKQNRINELSNDNQQLLRRIGWLFDEAVGIGCENKTYDMKYLINKLASILGARRP